MKYKIRPLTLSQEPEIEIDEARFRALKDISARDWQYLGIEEKFALVLANYEEFEREHLNLSLRKALQLNFDWSAMSDDRLVLGRRIVNVLTAARLYKDQVSGDLKRLDRRHGVSTIDVAGLWAVEANRTLGFRLMDELRNHVQHRSIPFDTIAYPSRRMGRPDSPLLSFGLDLPVDLDALFADRDFAAGIAEELESLPSESNDAVLFVRQYVEGIARVHLSVRAAIKADAEACRVSIAEAIEEWKSLGGYRPGLGAVAETAELGWPERVPLTLNASNHRLSLLKRSGMLSDLSRRYVTGERRPEIFPRYEPDA